MKPERLSWHLTVICGAVHRAMDAFNARSADLFAQVRGTLGPSFEEPFFRETLGPPSVPLKNGI